MFGHFSVMLSHIRINPAASLGILFQLSGRINNTYSLYTDFTVEYFTKWNKFLNLSDVWQKIETAGLGSISGSISLLLLFDADWAQAVHYDWYQVLLQVLKPARLSTQQLIHRLWSAKEMKSAKAKMAVFQKVLWGLRATIYSVKILTDLQKASLWSLILYPARLPGKTEFSQTNTAVHYCLLNGTVKFNSSLYCLASMYTGCVNCCLRLLCMHFYADLQLRCRNVCAQRPRLNLFFMC